MKAYTYRYLYTLNGQDENEIKVFFRTASDAEHRDLMQDMIDNPDIVNALREYVCEYDTDYVAKIEKIKTQGVKEDEKIYN